MKKYLLALTILIGCIGTAFPQINWQKKNGPYGGQVNDMAFDKFKKIGYAITNNRLFYTTDYGDNWHEAVVPTNGDNIVDVEYDPFYATTYVIGYSHLYTSTDGINFTMINPSSSFQGGQSFRASPVSPTTFFVLGKNIAGTNSVIWKSTNSGVTWTQTSTLSSNFPIDFVMNDAGSLFVIENGGNKIERSNDSGGSWTQITSGITDPNVYTIAASNDRSKVFCVTDGGIFQTTNGASWIDITFNIIDGYIGQGSFEKSLLVLDGTNMHFVDNANKKLYTKTVAGISWTLVDSNFLTAGGFTDVELGSMAVNELGHLYFGTRGIGVYKSINGGTVVTQINQGLEGVYVNDMVVADNGNIIVGGNGLFFSNDGGQTWTRQNEGGSLYAGFNVIKATTGSPKKILYFGGGSAARSDDNGASWNPIASSPGYRFWTNDGTIIYSNDNTSLYFSSNMGTSWSAALTPTGTPFPANFSIYDIAIDQTNAAFVYLYDYGASMQKIYKVVLNNYSTPTSATGSLVNFSGSTITYLDDIGFMDNKIFIMGQAGGGTRKIAYSSDQGVNWTSKVCPSAFRMDLNLANKYIILTGSNGANLYRINVSKDLGDTFSQSTITSNTSNYAAGVIIGQDNFGYALFSYAGLYKSENIIVTPPAPINLVSVGKNATGLSLRFEDTAGNEDGFVIQREISSVFTSIDTTGSNSNTGQRRYFRERNLQPATTYNYRVAAYNAAGASAFVPVSVTTLAQSTPSIPDNRSWTGITGNVNGLAAPGTNTAIGIKHLGNGRYSITDVTGGVMNAITGNATIPGFFSESSGQTYFEPNLDYKLLEDQNGTWNGTNQLTLFWRVDKDAFPGPYPDKYERITLTLNVVDPIPAAPTNVRAYNYNNTSIEVSWTGNIYEQQFVVERSTSAGGPFTAISASPVNYPATSVIDSGPLTVGATYFYRVKATNTAGGSPYSAVSAGITFAIPNFVFVSNSTISTNSTGFGTGFNWADFDNDGDQDAILTSLTFFNGSPSTPYAFRNNGDGTFTSVASGIETNKYITGIAADYDNDGNQDMFLLTTGSENLLYKGNGNMSFTKVNPNPVAENSQDFETAALTAGWVDYDKNGLLDLFVCFQGNKNILFTQTAPGVFTKNVTEDMVSYVGQTDSHAWGDFDNDGDMDVFMTNNAGSTTPNRLYRNNGNGTFTRVTGQIFDTPAEIDLRGFSVAWVDYDNDQDLDLFMATQEDSNPNVLYRNSGAAGSFTFSRVTTTISDPKPINENTFGSAWGDIDNDGNIDLLLNVVGQNVIYKNTGAGNFTKITNEKYNDASSADFGVALADYDKDGFLDIASGIINPALFGGGGDDLAGFPAGVNSQLYKNNHTASASANWLQIKLIGTVSNRSAIGARITVTAGVKTMVREISTPSGFATGSSLMAHFGLGTATTASISVKWPSGVTQNFTGQAANNIITIVEDAVGPVFTNRSPINGAGSASTAFPVTIEVNESSTPVAAKKLNIYLASNLVTPVYSINVTAATKTVLSPGPGDRYSFTLPAKLLPNTDYTVSIDAGAFQDVFGNASLALTGWTFKTSTAPAVSLVVPAPNATSVAVNSALEITFSKNITAVAGKKIKVMNGATTVIDLDVFTNGTIATNKYTLPAPAGNWPFSSLLKVSVDPGAFIDVADQNDFAGIPTDSWNFTTAAAPDVTPPVITFSVPSTPVMKGFSPFNSPAITVTDNIGVTSVVVSIRKISGTTYTPVTATAGGTPNTYTIQFVEGSHFDQIGTEFFITATDAAGNSSRGPDATGTYKIYLTYSDADSKIPATNIGVGGTKASWKVFSIPFELGSNNSVQSVFDELTQNAALKNKIDYRIITYKDQTTWAEFGNGDLTIFERGKGYFMNLLNPLAADIKIGANLTAPSNSRSNLFQMTLKQGWNMVGNPYLSPISWDDVKTLNALTGQGAQLVKYTGSGTGYSNNQSLGAYDGGFVFMAAAATVSIPFLGQTAVGGRKGFTELGTDINAEEWALPITLKQGEFSNELGAVGMAKDAHASFDDYDGITPPRFFDYLEMNFNHPEFFAHHFTRDVVPTQDNFTWEFSVDSNLEGQAELTWDNSPLSGSKDIFLLDISRQKLVNMKETGSYSFNPKESTNFRVYFGDNLRIAPDKVHLGKAYPNPTSGLTLMAFSLPESGGLNQQVTLDIVDAMGREMGTITQGRFNPGYHEITWDAKELHNGFYTYRLTVQGKQGRAIEVNKLIIK